MEIVGRDFRVYLMVPSDCHDRLTFIPVNRRRDIPMASARPAPILGVGNGFVHAGCGQPKVADFQGVARVAHSVELDMVALSRDQTENRG